MPNPFSITAATDTISLDPQGRGSITYTVSNVSHQLRRARAQLVPTDQRQAAWLSLDGEAERNFPVGGTQQYTIRVAVPPEAPAGWSTFGMDIVSVENPDEEWSQGPRVRFEVAPSQSGKKPFPWWIVAVAGAVLLVGGLVAWLMSRGGGTAPEDEHVQTSGVLGTCRKESDCGSNLTCSIDAQGQPGICVGKVGFKPCGSNRACAEGLVCDSGSCQAKAPQLPMPSEVGIPPAIQSSLIGDVKPPAVQDIVIPAKNYSSGENVNVGYFGIGIVSTNNVDQDSYLEYDISFPKEGTYELWVEYAVGGKPVVISFDSRTVQEQGLAATTGSGADNLKWRFQCTVEADAGTHLLRLAREGGFPQHIRSIKFVPRTPSDVRPGEGR